MDNIMELIRKVTDALNAETDYSLISDHIRCTLLKLGASDILITKKRLDDEEDCDEFVFLFTFTLEGVKMRGQYDYNCGAQFVSRAPEVT